MDQFNMNLSPDDISPITCKKCGGPYYINAVHFGRISPLKSPSGKEELVPLANAWFCISCGTMLTMEDEQEEQSDITCGDDCSDNCSCNGSDNIIYTDFTKKD